MTANPRQLQASIGPGAATDDDDLGEELCRVQAGILEMGEDNYERLRRVCPDPQRRYRVLQCRVSHQVRATLASQVPPWRRPPRPGIDGAAVHTAARDVWVTVQWQRRGRPSDERLTTPDSYVPGEPVEAEYCWCCDDRVAAGDIGLCEPCHAALSAR